MKIKIKTFMKISIEIFAWKFRHNPRQKGSGIYVCNVLCPLAKVTCNLNMRPFLLPPPRRASYFFEPKNPEVRLISWSFFRCVLFSEFSEFWILAARCGQISLVVRRESLSRRVAGSIPTWHLFFSVPQLRMTTQRDQKSAGAAGIEPTTSRVVDSRSNH